MAHKRESLLAQIEAGVLDDSVPVASLLQKCIVLGGKAGSEKMRDWARQELNGYEVDTVPPYRRVYTGLMAIFTNWAGFNGMHQRIVPSMFPQQIRDILAEVGVDVETAVLVGGIGELEALAKRDEPDHHLMPPWGDVMVDTLQKHFVAPDTRVKVVYWPLSDASLRGLLVKVRTALAELIAELIASTPESQDVPDKAAADQAGCDLIRALPAWAALTLAGANRYRAGNQAVTSVVTTALSDSDEAWARFATIPVSPTGPYAWLRLGDLLDAAVSGSAWPLPPNSK